MLFILNNTGLSNIGQFDGYDNLVNTLLGGEVAKLVSYATSGSDLHAKDVDDGYSLSGSPLSQKVRPIVTTTMTGMETGGFYLVDDGTSSSGPFNGYGTLFGSVVGGNAGQTVTGGANLGPATMTGSGKVTLWQNPGLYGVSTDAVDTANMTPASNLPVGQLLTYTTAGKLTPDAGAGDTGGPNVARFVEWSTGDTLVTTPKNLTRVGIAGGNLQFHYAVISWNPPL